MKITKNVLGAVAVSLLLSACGGNAESAETSAVSDPTPDSISADTESTAEEETAEETTVPQEVTLESQEIYNQDGLVITATGLSSDGFLGPEITLLVENNSDQGLTVQTRNSSVNGYMMDLQISCDVAAGKKANDGMSLSSSQLELAGIDEIAEVEFNFHIFNTESWETVADSEPITLTTSAYGNYQQTYDDSGDLLYDNNGIKIISKGIFTDDPIFGPEVLLYIENNSDKNVTIQARNTSINGFMVDPTMSAEVAAGKKAIDDITFLNSDLEENQITDIETIETSFHIFLTDGWDTIEDTEPISISK